ncbi:hypothetical protein, partial [Acidithiobacillus sp.]|uniref:hypothetical protein n=1 Tax=Acidithiobacillus sp. TaxID=1872118 RepID=UPI003D0888CC
APTASVRTFTGETTGGRRRSISAPETGRRCSIWARAGTEPRHPEHTKQSQQRGGPATANSTALALFGQADVDSQNA